MRLSLALSALFFAAPLAAQKAVARDSAAVAEMGSALRGLVTAEEAYFAEHATYTNNMKALDALPPARGKRNPVELRVMVGKPRGWTGVATHRRLPHRSCAVWVGDQKALPHLPKTAHEKRTGAQAEVTCDAP